MNEMLNTVTKQEWVTVPLVQKTEAYADDEIRYSTEIITPEKAREYLKNNINNRNISSNRIIYYATSMKEGKWDNIASPIVFDKQGFLIDGQHRLTAIIKANIPVKMTIARNAPLSGHYDDNMKRSIAQQLKIVHGVHYNSQEIAFATIALNLKKGMKKLPQQENIHDFLQSCNLDILKNIIRVGHGTIKRGQISLQNASFIYASYCFYESNPTQQRLDKLMRFIDIVKTGIYTDKEEQIPIVLRNIIISDFYVYKEKAIELQRQLTKRTAITRNIHSLICLYEEALRLYDEGKVYKKKTMIIPIPEELPYPLV